MVGNLGRICPALLCASLLCIPEAGYADSVAISSVSFSNLQIVPASGTVQFLDEWSSQAFAQGQNSLGEVDNQFSSTSGGTSSITAAVTYAGASATADAVSLSGTASSSTNILGSINAEADSTGIATLSNFFEITGATGPVDVTFSVQVAGSVGASADQFGVVAQTDTSFDVDLNGLPVGSFYQFLVLGPNSSGSSTLNLELINTVPVGSGTPENVTVTALSDSGPTVDQSPEPPTASFAIIALAVLGAFIRRKRTLTSQ
jgi:hypothetical protein